MKIAISTDDNTVSGHFGRCQFYTIVELEGTQIVNREQIKVPPHQPGVLPHFLNDKGVNCVITGGMGPRAQNLFRQMNIESITGITGNIDEVIQAYIDGKLEPGESHCTHGEDHHHGCND
jgi:predicted Fe-Mo cluster-binding NifX family protein